MRFFIFKSNALRYLIVLLSTSLLICTSAILVQTTYAGNNWSPFGVPVEVVGDGWGDNNFSSSIPIEGNNCSDAQLIGDPWSWENNCTSTTGWNSNYSCYASNYSAIGYPLAWFGGVNTSIWQGTNNSWYIKWLPLGLNITEDPIAYCTFEVNNTGNLTLQCIPLKGSTPELCNLTRSPYLGPITAKLFQHTDNPYNLTLSCYVWSVPGEGNWSIQPQNISQNPQKILLWNATP